MLQPRYKASNYIRWVIEGNKMLRSCLVLKTVLCPVNVFICSPEDNFMRIVTIIIVIYVESLKDTGSTDFGVKRTSVFMIEV